MKRLAPLLLLLCGCSIFQPVYDAAAAATKPLTVASVTWLAGALVNPVVAALTAGTVMTVWDVAETKAEVEEEKQENVEDKERQDELTRDIIAAMIAGETKNLTDKYDSKHDNLVWWLLVALVAYILKQPIWAALTRRRIKKHVQSSPDEVPTEAPQ